MVTFKITMLLPMQLTAQRVKLIDKANLAKQFCCLFLNIQEIGWPYFKQVIAFKLRLVAVCFFLQRLQHNFS